MKSPEAVDVSHGKAFERLVHNVFSKMHLTYPMEWRRVIDSAAAGNIIQKADGDFELTVAGERYGSPYRFRIECKASIVEETLARNFRSIIKVHQSAKMRLAARAGICGIYMFHAVRNNEIEIWSSRHVDREHPNKRKPFNGRPAVVVSDANFPVIALKWVKNPAAFVQLLIDSETLGD